MSVGRPRGHGTTSRIREAGLPSMEESLLQDRPHDFSRVLGGPIPTLSKIAATAVHLLPLLLTVFSPNELVIRLIRVVLSNGCG